MTPAACSAPRIRRITASYRSLHRANAAVGELVARLDIDERRLQVLGLLQRRQLDAALGQGAEQLLWQAFVMAQLRAAAAGLACGALSWIAAWSAGVVAVTSSPVMSALGFILLGLFIGLLLASLLIAAPRPLVASEIQTALDDGRWVVTVRTECADEARRIAAVLGATEGRPVTATSTRWHPGR